MATEGGPIQGEIYHDVSSADALDTGLPLVISTPSRPMACYQRRLRLEGLDISPHVGLQRQSAPGRYCLVQALLASFLLRSRCLKSSMTSVAASFRDRRLTSMIGQFRFAQSVSNELRAL
jgi:hypothetical protein